jgi:hypothetical protein
MEIQFHEIRFGLQQCKLCEKCTWFLLSTRQNKLNLENRDKSLGRLSISMECVRDGPFNISFPTVIFEWHAFTLHPRSTNAASSCQMSMLDQIYYQTHNSPESCFLISCKMNFWKLEDFPKCWWLCIHFWAFGWRWQAHFTVTYL